MAGFGRDAGYQPARRLPRAIAEAMASGLPVVTVDYPEKWRQRCSATIRNWER